MTEPIHWQGPYPVDGGTRCKRWVAYIAVGTELGVTYYPDDKPAQSYRYRVECGYNRPVATGTRSNLRDAQKAARDAIIDYADGLAEAARRITSKIEAP